MQCFIGCSGFYNKDWKEVFYPKGLPQRKWFEYYCTQFNTLELNTTFYRFPTVDILQKWYDKSPADFKFSVKAPRLITHYKQFNEVRSLLDDFYNSVHEGLKEKLGPVLFQLPARIIYTEGFLQRIVENLDSAFINVIEFRHISWWNQFVYDELAKHNISFCCISIKNLPAEIITNTPNIYYRFHGIKKLYFSEYSKQTIKNFTLELKEAANANTAYIYFNNTATTAAINNGRYLKSIII
jgi:uncharacterized protein YecE (DUF72 family)